MPLPSRSHDHRREHFLAATIASNQICPPSALPINAKYVKLRVLLLIGFALGIASVAYTTLAPADAPSSFSVLASQETSRLQHGERLRNVLFLVALGLTFLAILTAFWRPRAAVVLWGVVLLIAFVRAFLPSFPDRGLPFASEVFWLGLVVQGLLCHSAFRALGARAARQLSGSNTA